MRDRIGMSFHVRPGARRGKGSRGQSLTEFALALPILAIVVLIGLDFGRAFLGWVSLQQSARIAANYVSINPTAWDGSHPKDWHKTQQDLEDLLYNDASTTNCDKHGSNWLDITVTSPTNTSYEPGDPASVTVGCDFVLVTPIIEAFLGNPLQLGASASFPIRTTVVGGIVGPVHANFYWTLITGTLTCPDPCYQFTSLSSPSPTSYLWNFGDGTTSTDPAPTHSYSSPGTYTVTLTVTTAAGTATATSGTGGIATFTVPASAFPIANFTASPSSGTAPLGVQFIDTSSGPTPTSWQWDWTSDGVTDSTQQNPFHTYSTSGTFTAKLTVNGGSSHTATITVGSATPPPTADFTFSPTTGTVPVSIQFTDTSSGSPTSWQWDFTNDGTWDSTAQNPTHTYSTAGTYTIKLIATNTYGDSAPVTKTITVSSPAFCIVPTFVGDKIAKVNGQADTTGFSITENAKWSNAGFTTTVTFSPVLTNKTGTVTSQSLSNTQSCAASITLFGSW
jgi:PKD repeat protein